MNPPPRRRARPSTISTIGLTGAPPAAAPVAPEQDTGQPAERGNAIETALPEHPPATEDRDVTTSRPHEPTTSRPHDVTTSRRRESVTSRPHEPTTSRPRDVTTSPAVERPVSYTVRLSLDELDAADELVRDLRRTTGRRRLDRSEAIRALLALASADERLRARLVKALGGRR